jgi:3-hydroxyacyl-CoA dehydrogenase/enoyl-CoA hydratase/3-hydroxybutyryl-CoA epimerase
MNLENLRHWHVQMVGENTKLVLDKSNSSVNVLDREVMGEFEKTVEYFEHHPPKALMIASAKSAGFLAGADISEFQDLDTHEQVIAMLQRGQNLFLRVERLKCPTVALIHGHCMGGGMELALACDYRVVENSRDCKLGLPEVKLGIHPGYGGAIRLPRLIDPGQALQLMLAGRILDGKAAKRAGIADIAVHSRYFEAKPLCIAASSNPRRRNGRQAGGQKSEQRALSGTLSNY